MFIFIKSNFDNYYREAVVLTNEFTQIKCLYPEYKNKVIRLDKVVDYIKKEDKFSHNLPDSESKIKEICDKLISLTNKNVNDEINTTDIDIDEDDYSRLVEGHFRDCPYYTNGDEYRVVRHQM